jgi:hypothetical protein
MSDYRDPLSIGRLSVGIPEALLSTVFEVVMAAWPRVLDCGLVTTASGEDDITDVLFDKMYEEKLKRDLEGIDFDREPQSNLRHDKHPLGYIDVKVSYDSWRKYHYFAIECKKVSAAKRATGVKYIEEGVLRFVTKKYSAGHRWGGMIAYVCEGDARSCATMLGNLLSKHKTRETNVRRAWSQEDRYCTFPHFYSSDHAQAGHAQVITLLHLLLSFDGAQ